MAHTSPYELNGAIRRWARMRGVDVGRGQGYAGWSLFAEPHALDCMPPQFVIEYRGPDWPSVRVVETYAGRGRRSKLDRGVAFKRIVTLFTRISGQR